MKTKEAKELLDRYSQGKLSPQEQADLESWYNHQAKLNPSLKDNDDFAAALNELDQAFPFHKIVINPVKTYSWRLIGVAAAVLICMSAGLYFYSNFQATNKQQQFANDIKPGGNKAFLTLADGSKISLTDAINGEVAKQAGISITKTKDGQLIYNVVGKSGNKRDANLFNTIETPRAGQYQIKLPDGTQVWLNASSSLRYPAVFTGHERTVELKGEGYFEVAKDPDRPFKVKSGMQELQVLGTHFNVNAYADEAIIKTTLLEGSVRINGTVAGKDIVLKPGQQSLMSYNGLKIGAADIEESVAWKNGYFKFNDENIERILKKVSRWYDVDIQYEGKMTDKIFNGKVSRYSNVSEVLHILQLTGAIEFKIEGRRIIVMP
ncbi:FecR domain-containing protein [Pedobacter nyackensis]|uniref:FecR domain-containing protein n=1 Tax=Pedobacter nyackensis TaxID=475255 RepID=UPI00292FD76E|nr:FecR domain-containing protein [Pedobacter nyackensis]